MLNQDEARQAIGAQAYGSDGDKIGKVGQVYLDDETNEPAWATVNTGLFGTSETFVPLSDASLSADGLVVAHTKDMVKDAPNVNDDDGHLTPDQERALYEYYGIAYTEWADHSLDDGPGRDTTSTEPTGREPIASPTSSDTDNAMTLSEERVQVSGTTTSPIGRARLRKIVETEYVTQTVPVRRERVIVENIPPGEDGLAEDATGDGGPEVVLHEERPVLEKTVEPVERVRLGTEQYTSEETVGEEVRRERIDVEGDVEDRRNS
ncbi:MAG: DUF2382 domain-containing protein [Nocardioidaceae bacterium]